MVMVKPNNKKEQINDDNDDDELMTRSSQGDGKGEKADGGATEREVSELCEGGNTSEEDKAHSKDSEEAVTVCGPNDCHRLVDVHVL